ncbi:MAG: tetratricopeptide repeat protein, partial [Phaeodactylibacter sp.]|nr:tetratricopeptide repeat protein [Phaeodactylibacter sp.]
DAIIKYFNQSFQVTDVPPDSLVRLSLEALEYAREVNNPIRLGELLFKVGFSYYNADEYQNSIDYYQQTLQHFKEIGDAGRNTSHALNNLALAYKQIGEYDSAFDRYAEARRIYLEKSDTVMATRTFSQMAIIREEEGRWLEAIDIYFDALNTFEQIRDTFSQSVVMLNLGSVYQQYGDMIRGEEMLKRTLEIKRQIGDRFGEAIAMSSLAVIELDRKNDAAALDFQQQALKIYEELGANQLRAQSIRSIASIYDFRKEYETAIQYYREAVQIQRNLQVYPELSNSLGMLGATYLKADRTTDALDVCLEGYEMSGRVGYLVARRDNCECLSNVYENLGSYEKALKYNKEFSTLRDSLINEENARAATQKDLQFSFTKEQLADSLAFAKQQELREIEYGAQLKIEQNRRIALWSIIGLVAIFAGFIYNRFQVTRKQRDIIDHERERSENLLLNILP